MEKFLSVLIVLALMFTTMVFPSCNASRDVKIGDVNYDDEVDAVDALCVLQIAVELLFVDDIAYDEADVSGDILTKGKANVDAFDALLILQYAVDKIDRFPIEKYREEAKIPPKDTINITELKEGRSYQGILSPQFTFKPALPLHTIQQGACYLNGYFYIAMTRYASEQTDNNEMTCIHVLDRQGNLVRCSEPLKLGHANNISYNPDLDQLVVSHCQGSEESDYYTYSLVDPETFEITKTEVKDFPFFSMAYSPEKQQYASGRWSGETIDICDKDMNLIKTVNVTVPKSLSQGVFADGNYIYFIRSTKDSQGSELLIYNWDATLIHQIPIQGMQDHTYEPENINIINGTAYIMCNQAGFPGGHCFILTFREA